MALQLNLVGDPEADALLAEDPLALLIGMLLDQQVPMETAFLGPKKLADRLSGIDVRRIADMDTDEFIAVCAEPPAVHRFPKSMGERIQLMCQFIVENYDGDTAAIWTSGKSRRQGSTEAAQSPTRLRGSESPDLPGVARKTDRRRAERLAPSGRRLRARRFEALDCRRGRRTVFARGPRVQEGRKGSSEGRQKVSRFQDFRDPLARTTFIRSPAGPSS